jgi:hypothetical protein
MEWFMFCLKTEYEHFPFVCQEQPPCAFHFKRKFTTTTVTSGFYEGLKLKWEILTTARLNGTINRNFYSFYGKFRGHISFVIAWEFFFTSSASIWKIFSLVCQLHF